nr:single-pass membrane and coiled-coil domain-containing protein 3-like [Misgurnus anguillicaudatus]
MSWSDLFYPGNPEKREALIRKSQQFIDLMEDNFTATNDLVDVLNEHLKCSISKVTLDVKATLKQNCEVLIQAIRKIQDEVEKIDKRLKEKLEPTLYENLKNMDSALPQDLAVFSTVSRIVTGSTGAVSGLVLICLLKKGIIFKSLISKIGLLASSVIGGLVITVVFMGIDMIVGAIIGSIERDQLVRALKDYDDALNKFKPASKQYQKSIMEVRIRIQIMDGK